MTLLTHITSDVGLMFSRDGRTQHWGTDGSNCLNKLELLNISLHKVEQTKFTFSLYAAVACVKNPATYIYLHIGGGEFP